jgi:hypothetical protein
MKEKKSIKVVQASQPKGRKESIQMVNGKKTGPHYITGTMGKNIVYTIKPVAPLSQ